MRGPRFEHLWGTIARKGSFPVVLRDGIFLLKSGRVVCFFFLSSTNGFAGWSHKWYKLGLN